MGKRPSELGGSDPLDYTDEPVDLGLAPTHNALGEDTLGHEMTAGDYSAEFGDTGTISDAAEDDEVSVQREEIERTRSELSSTIDAIQEKLSPENLTSQAKEAVRGATVGRAQEAVSNVTDTVQSAVSDVSDTVQQTVQNVSGTTSDWGGSVVDVIRENPIPAALTGIGLGWLFMSMRKRSSQSRQQSQYSGGEYGGYSPSRRYAYGSPYVEAQTHYPDQGRYVGAEGSYGTANYAGQSPGDEGTMDRVQGKVGDMASQAQSTASNVAGKAQDAMSQAQGTAGQVVSQAQDTAGQFVNQAQQTAGQWAEGAQYGVQRAGSQFDRLMQERPLAVGAGALALGLVVGLAIPETQREQEWMGDTRDSLVERAQQAVQDTAGKVSNVAGEAIGAAKESAKQAAQDEGLTSGAEQSSSSQSGASTGRNK